MEKWMPINGYDYEVSSIGLVRSTTRMVKIGRGFRKSNGRILTPYMGTTGYYFVTLSRESNVKKYPIHRLVAMAFIDNPMGKREVNHIDGNKLNNHLENLEWVTTSENGKHAYRIGLRSPISGESSGKSKMTNIDVRVIREVHSATNYSCRQIAKYFKVSHSTIINIVNKTAWKHI